MSNVVELIRNGFKTQINSVVGAGWNDLNHVYLVEKNDFRGNDKRFGVIPMAMASAENGINRKYVSDQDFQVVLTHGYLPKTTNDLDLQEKILLLFDKLDEIFKQIYATKAGVPSQVLNIQTFNVAEPEILEENKLIVLRADFSVRYRQNLNN